MMDIYANAKRLDKVLEIYQNHFVEHPDITQCNILMKAYGNCNLANISEQVLLTLLNENRNIDIRNVDVLFHTLMHAWSTSSAPDAIYRAFNVVRIMKNHPKCKQYNIQPNVNTYTTLVRCLHAVVSSRSIKSTDKTEVGRFVEEIISEVQDTYTIYEENKDDSVQRSIVAYTTAIKVCLYVEEYTRAEAILLFLENSDVLNVPTKFYSELIHLCTQRGTSSSAIQGEKFLSHMMHLRKILHKPSLEPNERIYIKIIDNWIKSNDINSCNRVWFIYEKYLRNSQHFELSDRTYDLLIPYFATASNGNFVDKAYEILQRMEEDYRQPNRMRHSTFLGVVGDSCTNADMIALPERPNYRHYVPVIQGYLNIRDVENATKVLIQQVDMCVDEVDPLLKRAISPIRPIFLGIVKGWIELGQLEKASFIIETIQALYDKGKICDGPCIHAYHAILHAYINHPQSLHRHVTVERRGHYIQKYKVKLNDMKRKRIKSDFENVIANNTEQVPSSLPETEFDGTSL
jgi:hypothetical protein